MYLDVVIPKTACGNVATTFRKRVPQLGKKICMRVCVFVQEYMDFGVSKVVYTFTISLCVDLSLASNLRCKLF